MKNVWIIMKKELTRFFTDKRMLLSLILPAIVIYAVYSLMGNFMSNQMMVDSEYSYQIYIENQSNALAIFNKNDELNIHIIQDSLTEDAIKEKINQKEIDLYIKFEKDFDNLVANYESSTNTKAPQIEMYYNSTKTESQTIYQYYESCFNSFESSLTNKFDINTGDPNAFDLATKEERDSQFVTMLLPFLIVILLFSGCMGIATESIAGEKERGTIATLLITPVKRSSIALGKIFALSITALVSALSSFIALVASLPNLVAGADISMSMYKPIDYIGILIIIITTVLIFIVIMSIISALCKSIKEATTYAMPVMVIVMLIGITSLIGGSQTNIVFYFIPVYNSVQAMIGILGMNFNIVQFIITIVTNVIFFGLGILLLSKMFKSEKIMFSK
jgi:ABC-2 type transporter.